MAGREKREAIDVSAMASRTNLVVDLQAQTGIASLESAAKNKEKEDKEAQAAVHAKEQEKLKRLDRLGNFLVVLFIWVPIVLVVVRIILKEDCHPNCANNFFTNYDTWDPCPYADDGSCDTPQFCPIGDYKDCGTNCAPAGACTGEGA